MVKFEELNFNNIDFNSDSNLSYINFNGTEIAVKKKLDMNNIMLLSSYVLAEAEDPKIAYFHPIKFDVIFNNAIIEFYTDIEIPEDMTIAAIYDLFDKSGLQKMIKSAIKDDLQYLYNIIEKTAKEIITYHNSAVGIMEKIADNYSNVVFDTEQIKENLDNPEALELLRNIMDRFG
jgi:hypothetical protein